jgi:hypothetical protein
LSIQKRDVGQRIIGQQKVKTMQDLEAIKEPLVLEVVKPDLIDSMGISSTISEQEQKPAEEVIPILLPPEQQKETIVETIPIVIQEQKSRQEKEIIFTPEQKQAIAPVTSFLELMPSPIRKRTFTGYKPQVKEKDKFVDVGPAQTLPSALDRASFVADNTINATFRAREVKNLKRRPIDKRTGFFNRSRFKYRSYRADKKGRRKEALPANTYIERRKHRLDSKGEKQQIKASSVFNKIAKRITSNVVNKAKRGV